MHLNLRCKRFTFARAAARTSPPGPCPRHSRPGLGPVSPFLQCREIQNLLGPSDSPPLGSHRAEGGVIRRNQKQDHPPPPAGFLPRPSQVWDGTGESFSSKTTGRWISLGNCNPAVRGQLKTDPRVPSAVVKTPGSITKLPPNDHLTQQFHFEVCAQEMRKQGSEQTLASPRPQQRCSPHREVEAAQGCTMEKQIDVVQPHRKITQP